MSISTLLVVAKRCVLATLMALAFPVAAQQQIQFTQPVNQDPAVTANAFMPTQSHKNPAAYNAPPSLFGNTATANFTVLPGSSPYLLNPNAAQWQKVLNERKNWALMTPEQIMGIPTPESILGIPDPKEDPKLSLEERFLQRQDRQSQMMASNNLARANPYLWNNDSSAAGVFQDPDGNNPLDKLAPDRSQLVSALGANPTPFIAPTPKRVAGNDPVANNIWASPFGSPEPPPKPTPDQLAGMETFRALLDTAPPSAPAPAASAFSSQPAPPVDPFLQQSSSPFNPAGSAPSAVASTVSRPTGLTPLSGVMAPPPSHPKPAPLVQTPPWMSQTPATGTFPQRQF